MCSHVVVLDLSVRLSWYLCDGCGGYGDCDARAATGVRCEYAEE